LQTYAHKGLVMVVPALCNSTSLLLMSVVGNCSLSNGNCSFGDIPTPDCALFDFVLYTVVGGTLCVFGLVGNALAFVVLYFGGDNSTKTAATTLLLRALAVADSLVLLTCLPLYVLEPVNIYAGHTGTFHHFYMVAMPYLWPLYLMSLTATVLLTVLVSFHRYTAVCKPYQSATLSSLSYIRCHIGYVAVAAVLYNIPRFFEYRQVDVFCPTHDGGRFKAASMHLFTAVGENRIFRVVYDNILYFIVMLGGPLILLAFLNAKLIAALKERSRKRREMGRVATTMTGHTQQQQQQDLTVMLVVVVFVFIVCQTPTFVDRIIWAFVDENQRRCGHWHYFYTAVGDLMAILNSSVNFIVYVLASRKFRHDLFAIVREQRCACGVVGRRSYGMVSEAGGPQRWIGGQSGVTDDVSVLRLVGPSNLT